jgi:hypothetical protein
MIRVRQSGLLGKSITDLAEQDGVTDAYVCRLMPLTCLASDIAEAVEPTLARPEWPPSASVGFLW